MEKDRVGPNYSSFCCPTCRVETERSCCKYRCPLINDREEFGEECPLKKDQISECKIPDNNLKKEIKAAICCLILLFVCLIGMLLINWLINRKYMPMDISSKIGHGAVATDYADCSRIGTELLRKGGNAIDAGVAAAICLGVVAPHKTGLGGGGRMMIYSHKDRTTPLSIDFATNTNEGVFASVKVRVPGFLRGLEFGQSLRGHLTWRQVVEPSVRLAENGFVVSDELADEISESVERGMIYGHLQAGQTLRLPLLAETLEIVSQFGSDALYNGSISAKVLRDAIVKDELLRQLSTYEPRVLESEKTLFRDHAIYLPRDADSFRGIVQELETLKINEENSAAIESEFLVARAIVSTVMANGDRLKNLESERYSTVVATDPNENYVSIVTGLSGPLGLLHMTGAGFLLDGLASQNNLDSLTPIIFHEEKEICQLRGTFGADDPAIVAQILYNLLVRGLNISASIEYPRFNVLPDGIAFEEDRPAIDSNVLVRLESAFPVSQSKPPRKSVNGIAKYEENLSSHSDSRGEGLASRY